MNSTLWIALGAFAVFLLLVVLLSFRHREALESLIRNTSEVKVTPKGIDIKFFREVVLEKEKRQITSEEGEATLGRIGRGRILWVDDNPRNNESEIKALRERQVEVISATSNEQAVDLASRQPDRFDLILSDVDRGSEGEKAGLQLPRLLREAGVTAPIAFYVGKAVSETTDYGDPVFDIPSTLFKFIGDKLDDDPAPKAARG